MSDRQLSLFKGRRQRGRKPPPPLEIRTHIAVADALHLGCKPGWVWSHIGHGGLRSKATAALMQRMGVKPGWPDFLLIAPHGELHCLELKRGKLGVLSDHQKRFGDAMLSRGVPWAVARSFDEAIAVLAGWGAVRLSVSA